MVTTKFSGGKKETTRGCKTSVEFPFKERPTIFT